MYIAEAVFRETHAPDNNLYSVAVARDMATQQARDIVFPYHGLASIEPHFGYWNWK